jgi:hypothetical protein
MRKWDNFLPSRIPPPGSQAHRSGPGARYARGEYTVVLKVRDLRARLSRADTPDDNTEAEHLMKPPKQNEVDGSDCRDVDDIRDRIGVFSEDTSNRQRLRSALDYKPSLEF